MNACVIFNPTARGDKARRFLAELALLSSRVALKPTTAGGAGRVLAAEAVREGFETIIAAGGDGTLNEVINGIGDEPRGFERARLGVLPLGTVNVFARELGLPAALPAAWRVIEQGKEWLIDLPQAEFTRDGAVHRRYFAQLGGAGLDARAIELVDWKHKKAIGSLAYVVAGVRALGQARPRIVATMAQGAAEGELILVGNGRYYGGSIELFPDASLRDGLLDITVFPKANWGTLLRGGWGWLNDQLHAAARCQMFQAESFTLTHEGRAPFELDGDNVGHLPARFSVRPRALRVLVP